MARLRPMTEEEFEQYMGQLIPGYAQEQVRAGRWTAESAPQEAAKEVRGLLPNGLQTQGHYIYTIEEEADGTAVGALWFGRTERGAQPHAFVFDVVIYEPFRRRGYGSQAFRLLEGKVRELGLSTIALHVFGHNLPARAMYRGLGYEEKDVVMAKSLDGSE